MRIFKISDEQDIPVFKAADLLAEKRIHSIKQIQGKFLGRGSGHRFPGRKNRHNGD